MTTTAETLRLAAQVVENYWPEERIDVVTAIRIAAGPDDDGPALAEQALNALAAHLDYGHLHVWSDRQPTVHLLSELRKAADAAEAEQERAR